MKKLNGLSLLFLITSALASAAASAGVETNIFGGTPVVSSDPVASTT